MAAGKLAPSSKVGWFSMKKTSSYSDGNLEVQLEDWKTSSLEIHLQSELLEEKEAGAKARI